MHGTNIKIFSIYFSSSYRKKLKPTPDPLSFAVSLDSFLNGAVHQQQMAGLVIGKIQFLGNHAGSTVYKFLIGELHIDHPVSFNPTQSDHNGGGDHVQDHFLPCSRFHAGTAGDKLRPDNHFDCDIGLHRHR